VRDAGDAHLTELVMDMTFDATIDRMRVRHQGAGVGGATLTYIARKELTATSLQVAMLATATTGSDLVNSFDIDDGERLSLRVNKSAPITFSPTHVLVMMRIRPR
jgi:hypothetical protein